MDSRNPIRCYDSATLWALAEAFRETWAAMAARDPFRDWDRDRERRKALADKLMELADQGITDPGELQRVALASFPADIHQLGADLETRPPKAA